MRSSDLLKRAHSPDALHLIKKIVFWIDSQIDRNQNTLRQLRKIVEVRTRTVVQGVANEINNDLSSQSVLVICTNSNCSEVAKQIPEFPNVKGIYIFCGNMKIGNGNIAKYQGKFIKAFCSGEELVQNIKEFPWNAVDSPSRLKNRSQARLRRWMDQDSPSLFIDRGPINSQDMQKIAKIKAGENKAVLYDQLSQHEKQLLAHKTGQINPSHLQQPSQKAHKRGMFTSHSQQPQKTMINNSKLPPEHWPQSQIFKKPQVSSLQLQSFIDSQAQSKVSKYEQKDKKSYGIKEMPPQSKHLSFYKHIIDTYEMIGGKVNLKIAGRLQSALRKGSKAKI